MNSPRRSIWLWRFAWTVVLLTIGGGPLRAADSDLVKKLFVDPPRQFSSGPLWVWNDQLTEQQIVDTLRDLAGQKVKQVFVHPRPGLMTPYLSADWFHLWKAALREAERLDMNVWIYDENSYPSGFAGGYVPELMPEARGRGLVFRETKTAPQWEASTLAVFRLGGEQAENVSQAARAGNPLPNGQTYVVASVQRAANSPWHGNRCYVDLMYPGVTEKFLDVTLGAYQREIGDQFGKRVPGIFTDEPNIHPAGGLPWTDDLPEQFKKRWGYDLLEHLASLQYQTGDWRRVRHNYFSTLNDLFIERWAKPYRDRCDQLGLEMTGHYWEHEWPNCAGVPDNMAMYAWEQRPAIDCLMNQYSEQTHAQFGNVRSVRELGSIANQLGKKRTLCEVYGAGGWDLRFEDMKRQADWLGVLGVNTFDQHLSYVTVRGARKRDHPQSFSYHEPWWDAYNLVGAYLQRLTVAVSQGEQINHILVLEPTSTAWMHQGDEAALKQLGDSFFDLLKGLEAAQVEYDLGCEDVIARHGSVSQGSFHVGQRSYQTVVIPPFVENLNGRTWDLLDQYITSGGSVLGCKPFGVESLRRRDGAAVPNDAALATLNSRWQRLEAGELPGLLSSQAKTNGLSVTRRSGDKGILFHMRRHLDDAELVLLVNTSIHSPTAGSVESTARGLAKWNLETGRAEPYVYQSSSDGLRADFELPPCGSLLLCLYTQGDRAVPTSQAREISDKNSSTGQASLRLVQKAIGPIEVRRLEPNVLVLDYVDITAGGETRTNLYFYQAGQFAFQKNGMERNPWDSAVQFKDELIKKKFEANSGFTATYRFQIEASVPQNLSVVLERPDLYTITCNGTQLRPKPGAWWLDKAFGRLELGGVARVGMNELTITARPFTIYHELESAYVLGDFTLKPIANGFAITPDRPLALGGWNSLGDPFYAAGVGYRQRFNLSVSANKSGRYVVSLPKWYGSVAKVLVNGHMAGYIGYAPWQCDVTDRVSNGENSIEVIAIGTLKNTLGPHHGKPSLGTAWPGMFQKGANPGPPPGSEYDTVAYGLFEPFQLEQISSAAQ
jgi:hypothetical protein